LVGWVGDQALKRIFEVESISEISRELDVYWGYSTNGKNIVCS